MAMGSPEYSCRGIDRIKTAPTKVSNKIGRMCVFIGPFILGYIAAKSKTLKICVLMSFRARIGAISFMNIMFQVFDESL